MLVKKINGNKCNLGHDVGVSLKDLKERKMLFTYFKKYDSIKTSMGDMKQGECNKYFAYINHINSLYKAYKGNICHKFLSISSIPDYFDCNDKYDPSSLLPLVEHCKTIEPRTPEHIEHGTSEEHTELEDSGSEDEAGSRSDVVEHDVRLESGDEEDEVEEGEVEEAEFEEEEEDEYGGYNFRSYFVPRDRSGRKNVELERRRVPGYGGLGERRRTADARGVKYRFPSRPYGLDSERRQLSRVRSEDTEIFPDTSEPTSYNINTPSHNFLDTTHATLKSKYLRYSFIAFSMILVIIVAYHYYKSIKPAAESVLPRRKRRSRAYNNYEADLCAKEIVNGRVRAFMDPLLQEVNLSYQPTENYEE